uniref:DUF1232 domain-containing protein n=1 Tax=Anaerolinea thermolimosa TaxID=229919 RepID=A0A7C4KIT0_9CHLR
MTRSSRQITSPGFFQGLGNRLRLIARLMADRRVSPLLKLIPVASLVYLVVPTDLLPIIPLDDAAVLWLGSYLFVEMCPQEVVKEHWDKILAASNVLDPSSEAPETSSDSPEVIDAEFIEIDSPHSSE